MKFIFLLVAAVLFNIPAHAKTFRNAYIAFELPENWNCVLEQTEWVCRSQHDQQAREAIIIFTAKEQGPTDTLDAYERHLNTTRQTPSRTGTPYTSEILHSKRVQINDQTWIDGWHLHSEIPNYYTRYLATIKGKIAVLITFSAHRLHYTKYSNDFFRAIESLRVIASNKLLNNPLGGSGGPGGSESYGVGGAALPGGMLGAGDMGELPPESQGGGSGSGVMFLGLAFILLAIGAYFVLRKKK